MILRKSKEACDLLNGTNSAKEKKTILAGILKDDDVRQFFKYVFDKVTYKFNGTNSASLEKHKDMANTMDAMGDTILDVFQKLHNGLTGHAAISYVNGFIELNQDYAPFIKKAIDRDLGIGVAKSTLNKVYPGLIFDFAVALGKPYDPGRVEDESQWLLSRKYDGLRVVIIIDLSKDEGEMVEFRTREGLVIETMDNFKLPIEKTLDSLYKQHGFSLIDNLPKFADYESSGGIVIDCEGCFYDQDTDLEDFRTMQKLWRKKDYQIPYGKMRFKMFDIIPLSHFKKKEYGMKLSDRYEFLEIFKSIQDCPDWMDVVQQLPYTRENFLSIQADMRNSGWEGFMLRKDAEYKGKRTYDILKFKDFLDAEFEVVKVIEGEKGILNQATGLKEATSVLASVVIEFKGNVVNVGSGFTDSERIKFKNDPDLILGKNITVQYKQESQDEDGNPSLQFPVFKAIRS